MNYRYRFLEIDAAPYRDLDGVGKLVGPTISIIERATAGLVVRAGELPDLDFPGHQSYFVGVRFPAADQSATREANQAVGQLRAECGARKLPVVEVQETNEAHSKLIYQFGWGCSAG